MNVDRFVLAFWIIQVLFALGHSKRLTDDAGLSVMTMYDAAIAAALAK